MIFTVAAAMHNSSQSKPISKDLTILAFDYGMKKIGVALGNSITKSARPLGIIKNDTIAARFAGVAKFISEWNPDLLVVGLPINLNGQEQEASRLARKFANQLKGRFNLPVELIDERFSSIEAQEICHCGPDEDHYAAAVILERFFNPQYNHNLVSNAHKQE